MKTRPPLKSKRTVRKRPKSAGGKKVRKSTTPTSKSQIRSKSSAKSRTKPTRPAIARASSNRLASEIPTRLVVGQPGRKPIRSALVEAVATGGVQNLVGESQSHAGLDTGSFPGLNLLARWFGHCPYTWLGYYLNSPCHTASRYKPWMGNWRSLVQQGWGLAILFVGYQANGCGSDDLSRGVGESHGTATISLMGKAEGFANGCTVFLDVEFFESPIPAPMSDYICGWIRALLDDGRFKPGIYCHTRNANEIFLSCEQEFAAAGRPDGRPLFWVTHPTIDFDLATSNPSDSGVAFADIWQGRANSTETYNDAPLLLDENVSLVGNPSGVHLT